MAQEGGEEGGGVRTLTDFEGLGAKPIRIYSPGQVGLATFLGTPIAGCILLAGNQRVFGDEEPSVASFVFWGVAMIVFVIASDFLPDDFPRMVIPAAYTVTMYQQAKLQQGQRYLEHMEKGFLPHSYWRVIGIGLACLVGAVGALLILLLTIFNLFPELTL